jgi:molybdenum cofactor synthesis domain-containing protein
MQKTVTAAILVIGDEILSGRTLDTNTQTIARMLGQRGIQVVEARVVPDIIEVIIKTVHALRAQVDYVFTTGGIGPTHDDKTAEALAQAFDAPLTRNPEAWMRLIAHYGGAEYMNPGRAKMADIPAGATLIDNPVSSAPGFVLENVYVMAGVPKIMAAMLEGVLPTLQGGAVVHARQVSAEIAESVLAQGLADIEAAHAGISIGSYPKFTPNQKPHTTIVVRGVDSAVVDVAVNAVVKLMQGVGAESITLE